MFKSLMEWILALFFLPTKLQALERQNSVLAERQTLLENYVMLLEEQRAKETKEAQNNFQTILVTEEDLQELLSGGMISFDELDLSSSSDEDKELSDDEDYEDFSKKKKEYMN